MIGPPSRLASIALIGLVFFVPTIAGETDGVILSEVHLIGTNRLTTDDLVRGLQFRVGELTTRHDLIRSCRRLKELRLFESSACAIRIKGHNAWLTVSVKDTNGLPVVFNNFVWTTRENLLARLNREIPLFMPELPASSGLTEEIARVLEQIGNEEGIKAHVRYDNSFWTERGMNVFYVEGISTPVTALQIKDENAPPPEEVLKWSQFYVKEDFSAARLTWVIRWVVRDLYQPRGYLRAAVGEPVVQFLGESEGKYPVRVILPISSGDRYVFDSVRFQGLAQDAPSLLSKWKLKPGDPYDQAYVDQFIFKEILSAPWATRSTTERSIAVPCAAIDAATKKVKLTVLVEVRKKTHSNSQLFDGGCDGIMETLTFSPSP